MKTTFLEKTQRPDMAKQTIRAEAGETTQLQRPTANDKKVCDHKQLEFVAARNALRG